MGCASHRGLAVTVYVAVTARVGTADICIDTEAQPVRKTGGPVSHEVIQADQAIAQRRRELFGPAGKLAFISATLSQAGEDELPKPNPGVINLIEPPYTGQPRILLAGNSVAVLWEWLDENRLAYGPLNEAGDIGTAIVTLDGQLIELSPNYALAVLW